MRIRTISTLGVAIFLVFHFTLYSIAGKKGPTVSLKTILTNCNVIDCTGNKPMENMTVVITGNKITDIKRGAYQNSDPQEGVTVIDLEGAYVLPGFFNMHVHMAGLYPRNPNLSEELPDAAVIRAGLNAMDGIRYGFTTIRTMGDHDYLDIAWRDAFYEGFFMGPRIFACGMAVNTTAGGGGTEFGSDGIAEIRKTIRQRVNSGVNFINISPDEMLPDEIKTAIETTHHFGLPNVAGGSKEPGTYLYVQLGGDCVDHGYGLRDETIQLMAEMGTFYDPTIICQLSDQYIKERESRLAKLGYSENKQAVEWRTKMAYFDPRSQEHARYQRQALKKAAKAGVKLLIGSDSNPLGEIGILEMEQFVLSGVSEMETLIAATRNGAEMCGVLDIIGTVEEGKLADLVVVDGNPLENISNIRNVKWVFKDGVSVDLKRPFGPSSYYDYFTVKFLKKGYLGAAENIIGFRRGLAKSSEE